LVSVELGLLARVSTKDGVVLVQAQLTDNSWLLFPTIRLTGGFAFASWFGGPNKGQFVLTLGGYHPSFHRDGYPVVPRLGIAVDLAIEFGDKGSQPQAIDWVAFTEKYLEPAGPGLAHVLNTVPGKGGVPPTGSAETGGARSPDGSDANPFRVVPEFELTVTSTAPLREVAIDRVTRQ